MKIHFLERMILEQLAGQGVMLFRDVAMWTMNL